MINQFPLLLLLFVSNLFTHFENQLRADLNILVCFNISFCFMNFSLLKIPLRVENRFTISVINWHFLYSVFLLFLRQGSNIFFQILYSVLISFYTLLEHLNLLHNSSLFRLG